MKAIQVTKVAYSESLIKLSRTRFVIRPSADSRLPLAASTSSSAESHNAESANNPADQVTQSTPQDPNADTEVRSLGNDVTQKGAKAGDSSAELLEHAVNAMLIYVESIGKQVSVCCVHVCARACVCVCFGADCWSIY